jgi:PST family polysaccharide transporter
MLIIAALAPAVALFYQKPELIAVTLALSITLPLTSLGTQHRALLTRQMRFGSLAVINISAMLASVVAGVLVAFYGGRYWALVASSWTICAWSTLGVWVVGAHFRPTWAARNSSIRELVRFGASITAFDFINYFSRNLDNVLIGRVWGAQQLGLYSRAYALLMLPINNLRVPLNTVAVPTMSRLQNNPELFRAYYTKYSSIIAFISMPLVAFLFISSDKLIRLLLGSQWLAASELFGILALAGFIQPVASLRGIVLMTCGQGGRYFRWGLYNAIATVSAFACGVPWGAKGVAVAYSLVTYLILHPSLMYVSKGTPVRVGDFYRAIARPCLASIVMGGSGWLIMEQFQTSSELVALSITAIFCTLVYLVTFCLLPGGKKGLQDLWASLLLLRRGRNPTV